MMPARVESVELAVQRMRPPRQRMPIARVSGLKRPGQGIEAQTVVEMGIMEDVCRVIIVDKAEAENRGIERQSAQPEQETNSGATPGIFPIHARQSSRGGRQKAICPTSGAHFTFVPIANDQLSMTKLQS